VLGGNNCFLIFIRSAYISWDYAFVWRNCLASCTGRAVAVRDTHFVHRQVGLSLNGACVSVTVQIVQGILGSALLGYDAMFSYRWLFLFRRNLPSHFRAEGGRCEDGSSETSVSTYTAPQPRKASRKYHCTVLFNINLFCILSTEYSYWFRMIFSKQRLFS
jgi:hypothetical protein